MLFENLNLAIQGFCQTDLHLLLCSFNDSDRSSWLYHYTWYFDLTILALWFAWNNPIMSTLSNFAAKDIHSIPNNRHQTLWTTFWRSLRMIPINCMSYVIKKASSQAVYPETWNSCVLIDKAFLNIFNCIVFRKLHWYFSIIQLIII